MQKCSSAGALQSRVIPKLQAAGFPHFHTPVDFRLYLVTDGKLFPCSNLLFAAVKKAMEGGARAVQLREKELATRKLLDMAYRMRELTLKYKARLLINDRVDIALAVEADGVHIGQAGIPVRAVRGMVRDRFLIGASTHSIDEALKAEQEGADFITLGPVYETPSKLKYGRPVGLRTLGAVTGRVSVPVFAIGGITAGRARAVRKSGAYGAAVISAILSKNNVKDETVRFLQELSS